MASSLVLASTRTQVADYVEALVWVYSLLILAYILSSLFFTVGGRVPYARWSSAMLGFLHEVVEPYLRIFRRFIPPLGPLDLSPIVAILVLGLVGSVVADAIRG